MNFDEDGFLDMLTALKGWLSPRVFNRDDLEDLACQVLESAYFFKRRNGEELTRRDFGLLITTAKRRLCDKSRRVEMIRRRNHTEGLPPQSIDGSELWREIFIDQIVERVIADFPVPEAGNSARCKQLERPARAVERYINERQITSKEAFTFRHRWGWYIFSLGQLPDTAKVAQDALAMATKVRGRDGLLHQATFQNILAVVYRLDPSLGDDGYERAEWAAKTRRDRCGPDHPDTLEAEINSTLIRAAKGDLSGSETQLWKLFRRRAAIYTMKSPLTLMLKNDLGEIIGKQPKRHLEGERLLEETYDDRNKVLGASHPETISTKLHLAQLYAFHWPDRQDGLSKAEPVFSEVHGMLTKGRHRGLLYEWKRSYRAAYQGQR